MAYKWADRSSGVYSAKLSVESLVEAGLLEGNGRGEEVALAGPDETTFRYRYCGRVIREECC